MGKKQLPVSMTVSPESIQFVCWEAFLQDYVLDSCHNSLYFAIGNKDQVQELTEHMSLIM